MTILSFQVSLLVTCLFLSTHLFVFDKSLIVLVKFQFRLLPSVVESGILKKKQQKQYNLMQ